MLRILLLSAATLAPALPAQVPDQVVACRQRYLDAANVADAAYQSNASAERRLAYADLQRSARYAFDLVDAQSYGQLCQVGTMARLSAATVEMQSVVAAQARAAPSAAALSVAAALDEVDAAGRRR